jgi:deoxycytidylate deaminase
MTNTPDQKWIDAAIEAARGSPCAKSQRGVAVKDAKGNLFCAWNGLPKPLHCDGSQACRDACAQRCVHAEQQAIILLFAARATKPASLLHVKMKRTPSPADIFGGLDLVHRPPPELKLVPSGPPSCAECAKLILHADLSTVWLYHEDGWKQYTALEFYRATMRTLGLKED